MTDRLRWDPAMTEVRRGRRLFREPLPTALAAGAVVLLVGSFMPWAQGMIGLLPVAFGGLDGAADGLILATLAFVLLLLAWKEDFSEPIGGIRRWLPLVIGVICLGLWVLGWQSANLAIAHWQEDDGRGSIVAGYWVAGLGVAIVTVVGAIVTLRPRQGEPRMPIPEPRMARRDDIPVVGGWLGGAVGAVLLGAAAIALFQPVSVGIPLLFFGAIGAIVGVAWGRSLGRLARRLIG
jgi:hypothetical protein